MTWLNNKRDNLIRYMEETYYNLKNKYPNKDEHWLLANTWLARYGDWEVAKQKGQKLTKFIAYKDTFQFSILDSPKSIRALTLFLVYRELGEKEALPIVEEFNQLMSLILKVKEEQKLIYEYKKKNPFTWNEIESEKDESVYGLYGFFKSADYLNKNPEEENRVMKELEDMDREKKSKDSTSEGKVYKLDNPYLTQEEKVEVETWFQFPGNLMEYVFWIIAVLSLSYPIPLIYIIIISIIINVIAGILNWYFYKIKLRKILGLSLFHPFVTSVVGIGIGIYLFLNNALLLAVISAFVGIFSFLFLELHIFIYSFLSQKYYGMHPKYVFAKKYFGHTFPFENLTE